MADNNNPPPSSKGPFEPLNVYGNRIDVHYSGAGPKEGGTVENQQTKGVEGVIKDSISALGNKLSSSIDELGKTIVDKLTIHLQRVMEELGGGGMGGHGGGGGGGGGKGAGAGHPGSASERYYEQSISKLMVDMMGGKLAKQIEEWTKAERELREETRGIFTRLFDVKDFNFNVLKLSLAGLAPMFIELKGRMISFIASLKNGQFALDYFRERWEKVSDAAATGIGSFSDMLMNMATFGPSYVHTLDMIKQNLENNGMAFARAKTSVVDFGKQLQESRDQLSRSSPEANLISVEDRDQLLLSTFEMLQKQGIVKRIDDAKVAAVAAKNLEELRKISQATGLSLAELIKANKKEAPITIEEALARGQFDPKEASTIKAYYEALLKADPQTAAAFLKMVAAGGDKAIAFRDDKEAWITGTADSGAEAYRSLKEGDYKGFFERIAKIRKEAFDRIGHFDRFGIPNTPGANSDIMVSIQRLLAISESQVSQDGKASISTRFEELLGYISHMSMTILEPIKGFLAIVSGISWGAMLIQIIFELQQIKLSLNNYANAFGVDGVKGTSIIQKAITGISWVAVVGVMAKSIVDALTITPEEITRWGNDTVGRLTQAFADLVPFFITGVILALTGAPLWAAIAGVMYYAIDWLSGGWLKENLGDAFKWLGDSLKWLYNIAKGFLGLSSSKDSSSWWWPWSEDADDKKGAAKPAPQRPKPAPPPPPKVPVVAPRVVEPAPVKPAKPMTPEQLLMAHLSSIEGILKQINSNTALQRKYNSQ